MEAACLGLDFLGGCNYDPSNPQRIYFTIGELVSVVALLFAFYQLVKPITRFRIKMGRVNPKVTISAFFFALVAVFIASILPLIPGTATPLLGYPIFWELIAGLLIVFIAIGLMFVVSSKVLFRPSKAKVFFESCAEIIAKGNVDELRELANEVEDSIKPIFQQCDLFDSHDASRAEAAGKGYQPHETVRYAYSILDLWSDKDFCKAIVCHAPRTAISIFIQLSEVNKGGYSLSQQLIKQSFLNQNSLLMREEDYSGLGFFKQFRNQVYGDWLFVNGNYSPLDCLGDINSKVERWQVEKYCECLVTSFKSFFRAEAFYSHSRALSVALDSLSNITRGSILNINLLDELTLQKSEDYWVIHNVAEGLRNIITLTIEFENKIPEAQGDFSIYDVVAKGIYDHFEKLSMAQCNDYKIRGLGISIWIDIFGVVGEDLSKARIEIGNRVIIHLKKKIDDNFNLDYPAYPLISRLLISLNGLHESKKSGVINPGEDFHQEFIQRIKGEYPGLALKHPEFANKMLPEDFEYDQKRNEITNHRFRTGISTLKLND